MFKKNLFNVIGEIKTPERKLNVLMPLAALFTLAAVVYFLFNLWNNDKTNDVVDCKIENAQLKAENNALKRVNDSLYFLDVNDKAETIKQLELLIQNQNNQKKIQRKK